MSVKVHVKPQKLGLKIGAVMHHYQDILDSTVKRGATFCRNHAINGIASGEKTGKTYKRGNKTHTASGPGEMPATDTGELISSINISSNGKGHAEVIADAEHAKYLEFGTVNMEARPFLHPSLEATRPKINAYIKQGLKKRLKI